ncbi:hypothetical protein ACTMSW_08930 [Micromonospora sp. BQ11]|uniref:hypothetical protein n=1 Tax=Micromonospora sp. BQ11 TaxID=3452212 RepID=UPI003F8BEB85
MAITPSEVFTFVAVRPIQLATEQEGRVVVIRDPRAADAADRKKLVAFAKQYSSRDLAVRGWSQLDLTPFAGLVDGRRRLVQAYTSLRPAEPVPPAAQLVGDAGLADVDPNDRRRSDQLWDALYVAHATGPGAGVRLDAPTAALRALHFLRLLADTPNPSRRLALRALGATPAIAPEIDEILRPPRASGRVATATPETPASGADRSAAEAAGRIVDEVRMTRDLLDRLGGATAAHPRTASGPVTSFGELSRQNLSMSTTVSAGEVLGADLAPRVATFLDRVEIGTDTPVVEARHTLDRHLAGLGERALSRAGDPAFQDALADLVESGELVFPFPLPTPPAPTPAPVDPGTAADVDVHGRIRPLGIGDLKVVKQTLLAYQPGEVAYIENVLARESKSRVHRTLHRTQVTLVSSEEETRVSERDTQSTDRYELKREAGNTIKEDMSVRAGLQVTASYGPVVATASGDFAYSTSKEESQKASSTFAREVIERSVTKVQVKTLRSRTATTTDETEETSTHGVDNTGGAEHVVGVYRWVDKRYRAQVHNYGSRLLLEFVVPEPAAFYRAARSGTPVEVDAQPPAPFLNDLTPFLPRRYWSRLAADDLSEDNYRRYAARYGATGLTPPPPATTYISTSLMKDGLDEGKSIAMTSKDFVVPEGYRLESHEIAVSVLWTNYPKLTVQVGGRIYTVVNDGSGGHARLVTRPAVAAGGAGGTLPGTATGSVAVGVAAYDVRAFALNVQGVCRRDDAAYARWQHQTYDKIQAAYQALQTAYDQKLATANQAARDAAVVGQNPALNRQIEQTELKKLCITMMTGQHFGQFGAVTDPPDAPTHHPEVDVLEALREGPVVQFFEQAFEWEQMTYLFYPYFWGSKRKWVQLTGVADPDPLFQRFLTAGSCRVVVPVPIAYVDAVLYLLQSRATDLADKVWGGGDPPTLDSDLYVSLAEEFRNQTDDLNGAVPEGEPWEFTLPTTLVWLQPDGTLPSFV